MQRQHTVTKALIDWWRGHDDAKLHLGKVSDTIEDLPIPDNGDVLDVMVETRERLCKADNKKVEIFFVEPGRRRMRTFAHSYKRVSTSAIRESTT